MHDMLKKMKGKEVSSPHEKKAKMDVLSHLRDMASKSMGEKLGGIKKVSVMSNKPEGLEMGLEKAHDLVKHLENSEESPAEEASESPEEEMSESPEMEASEHEMGEAEGEEKHQPMPGDELHHSPEDVDAHIAHLMSLKKHLMRKGK